MKSKNPKLYYLGKYRIPPARLRNWDYRDGMYFVTININSGGLPFGQVVDGKMVHSAIGEIVCRNWRAMAEHFPWVHLDAFVVMPNHVHGLLLLRDVPGITHAAPCGGFSGFHNPAVKPGLARAIRWFKGKTTYDIRQLQTWFQWQGRYYDTVIRHENQARRVRRYIALNPIRWKVW